MKKNRPFYSVQDSIDLHGYTRAESHEIIVDFLRDAQDQNHSKVQIITGAGNNSHQGESVLKKYIHEFLDEEGYIFEMHYAHIDVYMRR